MFQTQLSAVNKDKAVETPEKVAGATSTRSLITNVCVLGGGDGELGQRDHNGKRGTHSAFVRVLTMICVLVSWPCLPCENILTSGHTWEREIKVNFSCLSLKSCVWAGNDLSIHSDGTNANI